jgi:protease I
VGGTNNDFETFKKAFHESATMIYMKDEYQEVNAIDFFEKIMKPGPTQNRKTSILSIDYSGSYASAKLKIDYPKHSYIDYMHLIKIDDEWKVVNQIFDRVTLSD